MSKYFARCSLGKNRAFWCVWDEGLFKGELPITHGYEDDVEAAEQKAKEAGGPDASRQIARYASRAHSRLALIRRRERPAKGKNFQKVEYVYNYRDRSDSDYPGETRTPEATEFRIYKKTRRRHYVEYEPGLIEMIGSGLYHDYELRTFVLDRREFEREGHAWSRSRGWRHGEFHATPEGATSGHASCRATLPSHVAAAVARLGLDESSIDQGKPRRAFREKSFAVHPDQGGDSADFLRLHEDREIIRRHFGYAG